MPPHLVQDTGLFTAAPGRAGARSMEMKSSLGEYYIFLADITAERQ
jgi:hypothetical protein